MVVPVLYSAVHQRIWLFLHTRFVHIWLGDYCISHCLGGNSLPHRIPWSALVSMEFHAVSRRLSAPVRLSPFRLGSDPTLALGTGSRGDPDRSSQGRRHRCAFGGICRLRRACGSRCRPFGRLEPRTARGTRARRCPPRGESRGIFGLCRRGGDRVRLDAEMERGPVRLGNGDRCCSRYRHFGVRRCRIRAGIGKEDQSGRYGDEPREHRDGWRRA
ncbi:hypothetical protein HRbin40_02354 [bacterium HR40]|nr:hypothetical protein HRbin40_02354 [bacterium HR40]